MIRRLARTDLTKRAADVLAYFDRPGTSTDFAQLMAGGPVIYRMRIYDTVSENLRLYHEFFRTYLMPVQLTTAHASSADGKQTTAVSSPSGNTTTAQPTSR